MSELVQKVRPFFLEFLPAVRERGMLAAVVTFSPQTGVIRRVLEAAFGVDAAREMPIRGNDGSWPVDGVCGVATSDGMTLV